AAVTVARKVRERARQVASAMLEVSPDDLEWERGRWFVRGVPGRGHTIREIALAAHSDLALPDGVEGHLDATTVYNPPNLTFPVGTYICVVDVDADTGQVQVRRFIAVDDCGVRINPAIVAGQVHRGLADGIGMALMELVAFGDDGNHLGGSFMDYLLPTTLECPSWELGETVTPSPAPPDRREGHRRVGNGRLPGGGGQRGGGRTRAVRGPARRHARDAGRGVAGDARGAVPVGSRGLLTRAGLPRHTSDPLGRPGAPRPAENGLNHQKAVNR
ncbi:MAG TPA: molybdopterin cofactor-binding domain-containing protein, partial [Streptomyces sp.]